MMPAAVPPALQKPLRYFFTYLLFGLFAFLGVLILINVHSMVIGLCALMGARPEVTYFWYVWGGFLFLGVYAVLLGVMESYLQEAAKTGTIFAHGVRVFAIEGFLALITVVVPVLAEWFAG
jgi:hypothetical protein